MLVKMDKCGYQNNDYLSSAAKALHVLDKGGGLNSIDFGAFLSVLCSN